jgi:hypothetical protein
VELKSQAAKLEADGGSGSNCIMTAEQGMWELLADHVEGPCVDGKKKINMP